MVVVPHSKLNSVINPLTHVADFKCSLDAEVRRGLKITDEVKDLISKNNANFMDN